MDDICIVIELYACFKIHPINLNYSMMRILSKTSQKRSKSYENHPKLFVPAIASRLESNIDQLTLKKKTKSVNFDRFHQKQRDQKVTTPFNRKQSQFLSDQNCQPYNKNIKGLYIHRATNQISKKRKTILINNSSILKQMQCGQMSKAPLFAIKNHFDCFNDISSKKIEEVKVIENQQSIIISKANLEMDFNDESSSMFFGRSSNKIINSQNIFQSSYKEISPHPDQSKHQLNVPVNVCQLLRTRQRKENVCKESHKLAKKFILKNSLLQYVSKREKDLMLPYKNQNTSAPISFLMYDQACRGAYLILGSINEFKVLKSHLRPDHYTIRFFISLFNKFPSEVFFCKIERVKSSKRHKDMTENLGTTIKLEHYKERMLRAYEINCLDEFKKYFRKLIQQGLTLTKTRIGFQVIPKKQKTEINSNFNFQFFIHVKTKYFIALAAKEDNKIRLKNIAEWTSLKSEVDYTEQLSFPGCKAYLLKKQCEKMCIKISCFVSTRIFGFESDHSLTHYKRPLFCKTKVIEYEDKSLKFEKPQLSSNLIINIIKQEKCQCYDLQSSEKSLTPKQTLDTKKLRESIDCHGFVGNIYGKKNDEIVEIEEKNLLTDLVQPDKSRNLKQFYEKKPIEMKETSQANIDIENYFRLMGSCDCGFIYYQRKFINIGNYSLLCMQFYPQKILGDNSAKHTMIAGHFFNKYLFLTQNNLANPFSWERIANCLLKENVKPSVTANWLLHTVNSLKNSNGKSRENLELVTFSNGKKYFQMIKFNQLNRYYLKISSKTSLKYDFYATDQLRQICTVQSPIIENLYNISQQIRRVKSCTYFKYCRVTDTSCITYNVVTKKLVNLGSGTYIIFMILHYEKLKRYILKFYVHWVQKVYIVNITELVNEKQMKNKDGKQSMYKRCKEKAKNQKFREQIDEFIKFLKESFFAELLEEKRKHLHLQNINKYKYLLPTCAKNSQISIKDLKHKPFFEQIKDEPKISMRLPPENTEKRCSNMISLRHSNLLQGIPREAVNKRVRKRNREKTQKESKKWIEYFSQVKQLIYDQSFLLFTDSHFIKEYHLVIYMHQGPSFQMKSKSKVKKAESLAKTGYISIQVLESQKNLIYQKKIFDWNDPQNKRLYNLLKQSKVCEAQNPFLLTRLLAAKLSLIIREAIAPTKKSQAQKTRFIRSSIDKFFKQYSPKKLQGKKTELIIYERVLNSWQYLKVSKRIQPNQMIFQILNNHKNERSEVKGLQKVTDFEIRIQDELIKKRMLKRITRFYKRNQHSKISKI